MSMAGASEVVSMGPHSGRLEMTCPSPKDRKVRKRSPDCGGRVLPDSAEVRHRDWNAFRAIVIALWAQQIGVLVVIVLSGRNLLDEGSIAAGLSSLLSWVLVGLCGWVLVDALVGAHPLRVYGWLAFPALYMAVREATVGRSVLTPVAFALVALTVAQLRVRLDRAMRLLGWLVIFTAVACVLVAVLLPFVGMHASIKYGVVQADKAIIPGVGLLKGLFSNPNNTGTFLALGLPFVVTVRPRALALGGLVLVGTVLVWTSSRSALAAGAAVVFVLVAGERLRPRWYLISFVTALTVTGALPFVSGDVEAFSARGSIWLALKDTLDPMTWVFGGGTGWFDAVASNSGTYINSAAVQAHNQALHLIVTGGWLVLLTTLVLLWMLSVRASKLGGREGAAMRAWLLALIVVGSLEVPLGYADRVLFWPVVLLPLAVLAGTGPEDWESSGTSGCAPKGSPPISTAK